jgi:hypothetical protein
MSSFRGKLLLVNFWATWCPPCVEELPLLDYFFQENRDKNIQVLGLAVDQPSKVRDWLQATPLHFPVGMAGMGGTELSKSLGNLAGSLPLRRCSAPRVNCSIARSAGEARRAGALGQAQIEDCRCLGSN